MDKIHTCVWTVVLDVEYVEHRTKQYILTASKMDAIKYIMYSNFNEPVDDEAVEKFLADLVVAKVLEKSMRVNFSELVEAQYDPSQDYDVQLTHIDFSPQFFLKFSDWDHLNNLSKKQLIQMILNDREEITKEHLEHLASRL